MTAKSPGNDHRHQSEDVPFGHIEQTLLLAALSEETATWCRQSANLRVSPTDDDSDSMVQVDAVDDEHLSSR